MIKIKVVDLGKLWNFVVDNFSIWNHLVKEKFVCISQIWNFNFVNDLKWRNYQNKSCRSQKVMKLCSWQLFDLKSSCQEKLCLNFQKFKIWIFKMTLDGQTAKTKVVDLKKLWNFIVHSFFIWDHLKKLWNFKVDNFLIWNHLVKENYIWISQI